ncbi:MAG TPA: serine/threonine-protein kinase [Gemmataceae bacterium]|jgi:serine/threonine protein kinase
MNPPPPPPRRTPGAQWIEREKYIEAFEAARAADPAADFAPFLPPPDHPLFVPVLEELVRIDLEHHWLQGDPRWLEDYLRRFPQLLEASASVRTLAFEEFRLRRRVGQSPTAEEYKQRFGIDPARGIRDDGPDLVPGPRTPPPRTDRFAQVMAALPHVGDQFLDYRLLAELGAGAYGRAFLAERAGRRVALKVGPALGAEPLTRLRHPNIVPVEEVFHVGSFRAVVMPYLGGVTLAHVLKALTGLPEPPIRGVALFAATRPELPPGDVPAADAALRPALQAVYFADAVLWVAAQVADGLSHAHGQGVLHLDLKPANVLFTDTSRPMLLDFHPEGGKPQVPHLEAQTGGGPTWEDLGLATLPAGGTLPYMAPEQIDAFRGRPRRVDGRADLFALGVILYQFFAGKLPFAATADASPEGLSAALAERENGPPDPAAANPAVPPLAAAVVRRLLAPDPAERFPDARALIAELRRVLRDFPLPLPPGPGWFARLLTRLGCRS